MVSDFAEFCAFSPPGEGAINVLNRVNVTGFEWAVYLDVSARSETGRFARFCAFSPPGKGAINGLDSVKLAG